MRFKLRLKVSSLATLADRYSDDDSVLLGLCSDIKSQRFLTKVQLQQVGRWKSPRSAGRMRDNSEQFVQDVTGLALTASDEKSRIMPLTSLHGVGWPTASVVLHFFHKDQYPILDFRALYSVGVSVPSQYNFTFWWDYVEYTRSLSEKSGLSMRMLDRALWQYSSENQRPNTT